MLPYSSLRAEKRIPLAQSVPLPRPLTVYIEPTNYCNLKCDFCPHSMLDYQEKTGYLQHMDAALFRKITAELATMDVKSLKLYFFGEPLIHPQIGEMCSAAAEVCNRTELTTNAIPMTERKAREILSSGINYLRISWYGEQPERVLENTRRLWRLRSELGLKEPYIAVKVFDQAQRERIYHDYSDITDEIMIDPFHTIGSDFVSISDLRGQFSASDPCPYPFYNLVIKANGDVVPCCVAWEKSLVIGNAGDSSLMDLWNSPRLREIQLLQLSARRSELAACSKCDTLYNSPDSLHGLTAEEYARKLNAAQFDVGACEMISVHPS